jgi:hypothetical protein
MEGELMGDEDIHLHRNQQQRTKEQYMEMMDAMLTSVESGRRQHLAQKDHGTATSQQMVVNGWLGFRRVDEDAAGVFTLAAPDILHGLFEGVLLHFRQALRNSVMDYYPNKTERAVMAILDKRLVRLSEITTTGWRVPTKDHRSWFSTNESFRAVEHEAVLQVLPFVLSGVFVRDGIDLGLRCAVAMCEWWLATCRMPDITQETMEKSEIWAARLMRYLSLDWGDYQQTRWCFPKFHNISHFSYFIRYISRKAICNFCIFYRTWNKAKLQATVHIYISVPAYIYI